MLEIRNKGTAGNTQIGSVCPNTGSHVPRSNDQSVVGEATEFNYFLTDLAVYEDFTASSSVAFRC